MVQRVLVVGQSSAYFCCLASAVIGFDVGGIFPFDHPSHDFHLVGSL